MEIFSTAKPLPRVNVSGLASNGVQPVFVPVNHGSSSTPQSGLPRARILYIEDEKDLVTLVQLIFTRQGYQIVGARTIAQAKDLIEREKIDLFFVDLNLPDGTGWDLMDFLNQHEKYAQTPKIIMSAQVTDQKRQVESESEKRYAAIVSKPFQVNVLIDVTQRLLGHPRSTH